MESLRGKLLLAAPAMGDPNFERAVILLVQHGEEGAMGLVLNRPTGVRVRDALAASNQEAAECGTQESLMRGGPCEGPLMVLHGDPIYGQEQVMDGVYFATERDLLEPVLAGEVTPAKFFAGYAGWSAGQLENELATGSWVINEAVAEDVFRPGRDPWAQMIRTKQHGEMLKDMNPKIVPEDPSLN